MVYFKYSKGNKSFLGNGGNYMLYCDEYDKNCNEVTSEECDNGCCDSCMYCVVCTNEE